jgi:transcriptional regulator with XRE-family HTH domain
MSPSGKTSSKRRSKAAPKRTARKTAPARSRQNYSPSLGEYLRRQRNLANKSLRKVAQQTGIPTSLLSDIEAGIRKPSRTILGSLAGALRLSADTLYLQAGVIDPQDPGESDVVREIERDPRLTQRQAEILIDLYRTFRQLDEQI